jgi:hypothetical protein
MKYIFCRKIFVNIFMSFIKLEPRIFLIAAISNLSTQAIVSGRSDKCYRDPDVMKRYEYKLS